MKFDDVPFGIAIIIFFTVMFWMIGVSTCDILYNLASTPPVLYPLVACFFLAASAFVAVFVKSLLDITTSDKRKKGEKQ